MNELIIIRNGKIFENSYNDNLGIYQEKEITKEEFARFYSREVKFEEGLTVEGFMNAMHPFFDVIESHFVAYTGGFPLQQYYDVMKREGKIEQNDDVSHIEFYWGAEYDEYENLANDTVDKSFYMYGSYHGVPKDDKGFYSSFSLSPLCDWKHYELKIKTEFSCTFFNKEEKKMKTLFTANKEWSFYDIIKAFFYELTWYGSPEDAQRHCDHLNAISEAVESGEMETVELDLKEWELEILENDLENARQEQNYEGMRRIQNKIDEVRAKIDEDKNK